MSSYQGFFSRCWDQLDGLDGEHYIHAIKATFATKNWHDLGGKITPKTPQQGVRPGILADIQKFDSQHKLSVVFARAEAQKKNRF